MSESKKNVAVIEEEPGGQGINLLAEGDWQVASKNSIKNIEELSRYASMKAEEKAFLKHVVKTYRMRITPYYFSLIKDVSSSMDPIRMQCVPSPDEMNDGINEAIDPLGEEKTSPTSYLVHRYPDRVLLLVTGRCFMYCRHCTRKRLWQDKIPEPTLKDIDLAIKYIKENKQIREVIVSGGDPLTLSTNKIDYILSSVSSLENIEIVRIGTRAPVVLPQRVDDELCKVLEKYSKLWINVQFNHPAEITSQSREACGKIQKCGIPVSNQSVLLRGINDDPAIMTELCHKLQSIRVRPYYLFQCDPVVGASHFRTSVWKGVEVIEKMRGHTSGMCIPTFVVDGIDGKGKVPLAPNYLVSMSVDGVSLRNYKNEVFFYRNPGNEPSNNQVLNMLETARGTKKPKTIGIAFNLKNKDVAPGDDQYEEYDEIETVEALREELERYGFSVVLLEQNEDFLKNILEKKPDFVFNIAEGIGNSRARESQIPCILESLKIPYSGSDPISLGLTLDKYLTSLILKSAGVPVPSMYMVKDLDGLEKLKDIFKDEKFYIVKPRWEGSSKGIFSNSIVKNFEELKDRVSNIISNYQQPALVEEFLEGDEITAGVCGNGTLRILEMMKITPKEKNGEHFLYSIENKREWESKIKYEPRESISTNIQNQIKKYSSEAFHALELKDYARVDFRVDRNNVPKIIDINPLPGLSPYYSDLTILYKMKGKTYSELVKTLLRESLKRHGFKLR